MSKIITLSSFEMKQCRDFSLESAESQQPIEFGQHDTKPRSKKEIARDNLIGKMAEVGVAKMLQEWKDKGLITDFAEVREGRSYTGIVFYTTQMPATGAK